MQGMIEQMTPRGGILGFIAHRVSVAGELKTVQEGHQISSFNEERYRLLIDSITDYAIYMLDPKGHIASWNPGARRFKGFEESEILGQHFSRFYTLEDRVDQLPERALRLATDEGRFENEGWRVRKDGSRFWAHVIIDPIRDGDGRLLGFAKVTRDLTERRNAEAELKRSERQFEVLVQGVSDYALYMLDAQGNVSNWNHGAERIKGYRAEEIVSQHFSTFYTTDDRAAGEPGRNLATALRDGRFEGEGWRHRKDGTRFWAHVIIDAIRDETGELRGFAKITRDITEKVEAQKALMLAREELFQAQKLEAIGQLTGGIAHDFNNLLMAVLGSLEILKKRLPDDPSLMPLLQNAIHGAERGAALTQRMLAFSRRQELNMAPIGMAGLIDGMMDFFQRSLGSDLGIVTDIPAGLPPVLSDAVQLESALLNLVVNARDAMTAGGTVTITARDVHFAQGADRLSPGHYVKISVADTGEGMEPETLARATTPFFTTKGVGKGTGLGLPMVQGLTEQSGGRLSIDSQKGKGTTVSLFLPVARLEDCPEKTEPTSDLPAARPKERLRVLAVDDDALVLMNTSLMLEDLGHTVVEAYSGGEALKLLARAETIDLVITDHSMPGMTGSELASEINRQWPGVPVLLATGYAELPPGEDGRLQLPLLPKPFSQNQLADMIATVLGSAR
jgi:PAS domain S-box-containing protein